MKCPNCGAEVNGKFCAYCGSAVEQEVEEINELNCYKECPRCGSKNIKFRREQIKNSKRANGKYDSASGYKTVGFCEECGYTWDPLKYPKKKINGKTILWILGWLCIFPVPLTILLLRSDKIKSNMAKYIVIAMAWIAYLIIGIGGNSNKKAEPISDPAPTVIATIAPIAEPTSEPTSESTSEPTSTPTTTLKMTILPSSDFYSNEDLILYFINKFNENSTLQLTNPKWISIEEGSEYYRHEYHLSVFNGAIAYQLNVDENTTMEIVAYGYGDNDELRIYVNTTSKDIVVNIFCTVMKIYDETITVEEINNELLQLDYEYKMNEEYNFDIDWRGSLNAISYFFYPNYNEFMMDGIKFTKNE